MTPSVKAKDIFYAQTFDAHEVLRGMAEKYPLEFLKLVALHEVQPKVTKLTSDQEADVKDYVGCNQVVTAIKYVRSITGWGLKEAKAYVDQYRSQPLTMSKPTLTQTGLGIIKGYLEDGKRNGAIRYYREATGVSLQDAVDAVDHIKTLM